MDIVEKMHNLFHTHHNEADWYEFAWWQDRRDQMHHDWCVGKRYIHTIPDGIL